MTNKEFIELVVRDKKVPYDNNLLNDILYQYFKSAIEFLEKQIDFDYMEEVLNFSLLPNTYEIPLNVKVKKIMTLYDKTHKFELTGDYDASLFYKIFEDKPAIPRVFIYHNNKIKFPVKLKEATEYVIRLYKHTYNDSMFVGLDASHPLIEENSQLLMSTLGTLIDRYYSPVNQDFSLLPTLLNQEKNSQIQRKTIMSKIRIDYRRY